MGNTPGFTSGIHSIPHDIHKPWNNWGENQTATPTYTVRPRNADEAVTAVRFAIEQGLTVRAVGAGHSFTPLVQTGGMLLDLAALTGVISADDKTGRVRVHAGTAIRAFGQPLWAAGLSLANQGDIDKQAIAGAISTGTHGSGINLGSFSSAVRAVKLINGLGEVVEIDESEPEKLLAAQVALGTMGIFLEVELQTVPSYYLQEEITYPTWEETVSTWDEDIRENRHYSFLWCPHEESAGLYELPTPSGLDMVNRSYTKKYNAVDVIEPSGISTVEGERCNRAYNIYAGGFDIPFHELEYYVPAEHSQEAVAALQNLMRDVHPDQHYPIEVRWIKGDGGYLSPFQGRDSTSISVSGLPGTNYWPYLQDVDQLLQKYQARAHWGKIHFLTRDRVDALYPDAEKFREIRRSFDPNGVFLNDHTRALLS